MALRSPRKLSLKGIFEIAPSTDGCRDMRRAIHACVIRQKSGGRGAHEEHQSGGQRCQGEPRMPILHRTRFQAGSAGSDLPDPERQAERHKGRHHRSGHRPTQILWPTWVDGGTSRKVQGGIRGDVRREGDSCWWRNDLALPAYLSAEDMPFGGATETAELEMMPVYLVIERMREAAIRTRQLASSAA